MQVPLEFVLQAGKVLQWSPNADLKFPIAPPPGGNTLLQLVAFAQLRDHVRIQTPEVRQNRAVRKLDGMVSELYASAVASAKRIQDAQEKTAMLQLLKKCAHNTLELHSKD